MELNIKLKAAHMNQTGLRKYNGMISSHRPIQQKSIRAVCRYPVKASQKNLIRYWVDAKLGREVQGHETTQVQRENIPAVNGMNNFCRIFYNPIP